jgi:hypothetical protein
LLFAETPECTAQARRTAQLAGTVVGEHLDEELHRTKCRGRRWEEREGLTPGEEGL